MVVDAVWVGVILRCVMGELQGVLQREEGGEAPFPTAHSSQHPPCPFFPPLQLLLPTESQAWAGLKGRTCKSAVRVPVHARPEGVIAITPSQQLVVTGSADGLVATHTTSLLTVGMLDSGSSARMGSVSGDANGTGGALAAYAGGARVGLHDAAEGGVVALSFDHR